MVTVKGRKKQILKTTLYSRGNFAATCNTNADNSHVIIKTVNMVHSHSFLADFLAE
jgi:hypothetical protein